MTDTKPAFEMSIDTRVIYDRLKSAAIGQTVTFDELSKELGRKVEGDSSNIQSALRRLVNTDGIVFDNVRGLGYKRLNDVEIVNTSERDREGMRRQARKIVKRLTCVSNFDALPNDMKIKHNAALSGFGAIAAIMTPGAMKKLEASVEQASQQLPLAKTLEAFRV